MFFAKVVNTLLIAKKEAVSKFKILAQFLFLAQSPDFLKPRLCYYLKYL